MQDDDDDKLYKYETGWDVNDVTRQTSAPQSKPCEKFSDNVINTITLDREGIIKQHINNAKETDVSITQACVVQKQTIIILLHNKTNE